MTLRPIVTLFVMLLPVSAHASDLNKTRMSEPKATYETTKSMYDVERCLLGIDTPDVGIVYRAPDRPNESIVYWAGGFSHPMVVEITTDSKITHFVVKQPAKGVEKRFAACA